MGSHMVKLWSLRRRQVLVWSVLFGLLALLVAPVVVLAFQRLAADSPSPATGHAQVVAQGVAPMPASSVAWRVVRDTAELPEDSADEERALGFALTDRMAIVIDDASGQRQQRLAAGEAAFVPQGAIERRSSLAPVVAPYYRIALVPTELASDAGGDRMVYAGRPFAAPAGRAFDIDLVRDVVAPDDEIRFADSGAQALVLVTSGSVDVRAGTSQTVRLSEGEAASFTGPLQMFGVEPRPATYVVAVIGPEVPAPPRPVTGSISLAVRLCEPGIRPETLAGAGWPQQQIESCPLSTLDPAPALQLANGNALAPDEFLDDGRFRWNGLLPSPFPFLDPELPRTVGGWVLLDEDRRIIAANAQSSLVPDAPGAGAFLVEPGRLERAGTLMLFRDATGRILFERFDCPALPEGAAFDPAPCEPGSPALDIELAGGDGETILLDDPAIAGEQAIIAPDLPFGTYTVELRSLPEGVGQARIGGADFEAATGTYRVTLDAASPERTVRVYMLGGLERGSLTVRTWSCPSGMTRETVERSGCVPADPSAIVLIDSEGATSGVDDGALEGNSLVWDELPFGYYTINDPGFGAGFDDLVIAGAEDFGGGWFGLPVSADGDAPVVDVFRLAPAVTPGTAAPGTDSDGDGLSDEEEDALGTDPFVADTDGDGRADGDEVGERQYQTDPLNPDTDGDGVGDGEELFNGTDPTDPASVPAGG
jgi:hypothetical protein